METIKKTNEMPTTMFGCIVDELTYLGKKGLLKGKRIVCLCDSITAKRIDNDTGSEIYEINIDYSREQVNSKGKSVPKVHYDVCDCGLWMSEESDCVPDFYYDIVNENEVDDFLRDELTDSLLRVLTQLGKKWGIKSICGKLYGCDLKADSSIPLYDFDPSEYDICIATPRSITAQVIKEIKSSGVDYVILAPVKNRGKWVSQNCYLGYTQAREVWDYGKYQSITSFPDAEKERERERILWTY